MIKYTKRGSTSAMQSKNKQAFTLAEVLITLAIIGVVAAMVVPAIQQSTNNKETVVGVKKAYSVLNGAFQMLKARGYDIDAVFAGSHLTGGSLNVMNNFNTVMAFSRICGETDTSQECIPNLTYKNLDGSDSINFNTTTLYTKAVLNDGTSILIDDDSSNGCNDNYGTGALAHTCGSFYVDTNGSKPPNQYGRDFFFFWITRDSVLPRGIDGDTTHPISSCSTSGSGKGCAAKVLQENAINY